MRILHRYITGSLLRGYLPVLAFFLAIFSLLAFIEELDQVGKGRYTFLGAGEVLLLTLPVTPASIFETEFCMIVRGVRSSCVIDAINSVLAFSSAC